MVFQRSWMYAGSLNSPGSLNSRCVDCIYDEFQSSGRGRNDFSSEPLNQPKPMEMHGKLEPCVWCGSYAQPKYRWHKTGAISACGWAHAGLWMDRIMGADKIREEKDQELAQGIDYVRKSLGVE